MSYLKNLLESAVYVPKIKCRDKKELLRKVAHLMIEKHHLINFTEQELLYTFLRRESLGSTTGYRGVAMPHCRLGQYPMSYVGFFTVDPPVDFDSLDREPVFLIVGLIIPECWTDRYLKLVACLAELLFYGPALSNITQLETPDQLKSHFIKVAYEIESRDSAHPDGIF